MSSLISFAFISMVQLSFCCAMQGRIKRACSKRSHNAIVGNNSKNYSAKTVIDYLCLHRLMWQQSGGLKRTEDCDFLQNVREYKMRTESPGQMFHKYEDCLSSLRTLPDMKLGFRCLDPQASRCMIHQE